MNKGDFNYADDSLENWSLYYAYKVPVWISTEVSTKSQTIHTAMRLIRSLGFPGGLNYVSVPFSSGKVLYDLMLEHPGVDKKILMTKVIADNYKEGKVFYQDVVERTGIPAVFPGDFSPAGERWGQEHYQGLWLPLIAEVCTGLHLRDGWWYSDGCSEEFTHVMQLRLGLPHHPGLLFFNSKESEEVARKRMRSIGVYDHSGKPLSLDAGMGLITKGHQFIVENGFSSEKIEHCLRCLDWTRKMMAAGFYQ